MSFARNASRTMRLSGPCKQAHRRKNESGNGVPPIEAGRAREKTSIMATPGMAFWRVLLAARLTLGLLGGAFRGGPGDDSVSNDQGGTFVQGD